MRLHKDKIVGRRPWFRVAELERETRRKMKKQYDRKTQLVDKIAKVMNLIADGSPFLVHSFGDDWRIEGHGGILEIAGDKDNFCGTVGIYRAVTCMGEAKAAVERCREMGLELLASSTKETHVHLSVSLVTGWEATEEETAKAFISKAFNLYVKMFKCIVP